MNEKAFYDLMNGLSGPAFLILLGPLLGLIVYIAFLVKLWSGLTAMEKMLPLMDDMHYWMRAQYESEKRTGHIVVNDMDKAEEEIR